MNLGLSFPDPKKAEKARERAERLDAIDAWLEEEALVLPESP